MKAQKANKAKNFPGLSVYRRNDIKHIWTGGGGGGSELQMIKTKQRLKRLLDSYRVERSQVSSIIMKHVFFFSDLNLRTGCCRE